MAEVDIASHDLMTKETSRTEPKQESTSHTLSNQPVTNSSHHLTNLSLSFINYKPGTPNHQNDTLEPPVDSPRSLIRLRYLWTPPPPELRTASHLRGLILKTYPSTFRYADRIPSLLAETPPKPPPVVILDLGSYPRGHRKHPHNLGPSLILLYPKYYTKPPHHPV
ncbi:hypothetical protein PGT21_013100 [Puccinia graminis f. sp. tritici]|uniref:Uncharacterized protein n=1 Tax=Puccinia graminis f. sp. tritici TaxID=56615 RepID=A0A5B0P961_PUCGR|nr:hypothetical protein PGT21_013100 [Puccinia graminis f. sp. tritici]KAA1134016.1 hypothetical protein PGTUg99_015503 [Puccinia graminis f. sp. tritici]